MTGRDRPSDKFLISILTITSNLPITQYQIKIPYSLEEERGLRAGMEMTVKPRIWERLSDTSGQALKSIYFFLLKNL